MKTAAIMAPRRQGNDAATTDYAAWYHSAASAGDLDSVKRHTVLRNYQ